MNRTLHTLVAAFVASLAACGAPDDGPLGPEDQPPLPTVATPFDRVLVKTELAQPELRARIERELGEQVAATSPVFGGWTLVVFEPAPEPGRGADDQTTLLSVLAALDGVDDVSADNLREPRR